MPGNPLPTSVIDLAQKVLAQWQANPELFARSEVTQAELESLLTQATAALHAATDARTQRKNSTTLLKTTRDEAVAKARSDYETAVATLNGSVQTATQTASELLKQLSRAANGARYTAKAKALSDADSSNDKAIG